MAISKGYLHHQCSIQTLTTNVGSKLYTFSQHTLDLQSKNYFVIFTESLGVSEAAWSTGQLQRCCWLSQLPFRGGWDLAATQMDEGAPCPRLLAVASVEKFTMRGKCADLDTGQVRMEGKAG